MIGVLTALGAMAVIGGLIWVAKSAARGRTDRSESTSDGGAFVADGSSSDNHHSPDCGHGDHGGDSAGGDSGGSDGSGSGD